mmetsp:Transcript_2637/g.4031  ORF Transcript_2637/g.4031 Transcript_2637/m.4031 type:complete len:179 (-) Transcript_2637:570-1106(-)
MYLTRAIRQQGTVSGFRYAFKRATTKEHFEGIVAVQRDCFASPKERTTANALEAMQNYKGGDIHKFVIEASSSDLDLPENYLPKTHVNRTVAAYILYNLHKEEGAHIISIGTSPSHQKQGHGIQLMNWCLAHARDTGCDKATLKVRASNFPALSLYERLGFEHVDTTLEYYSTPVEDA